MAAIGDLFITIGSKLDSTGFKKASEQITKVGKAAAVMGAVVTAVGLKVAYTAGVQERAELTLAQAMKQAGTYTKEAFEHNKKYASSLQLLTEYGDEAILGVQKFLTNFGVAGPLLDDLTKSVLDLASAKGMDLKAAADLVSKSVGSSTNALSRYGIEVTGAVGSTERMQIAVDNISKLFGGAAAANAATYLGRVKSLSNVWGDFQEKIGFKVIPIIEDLIATSRDFILDASKWIDENKILVSTIASLIMKLGGLATVLGVVTVAVITLIPHVKALAIAMSKHPIIAIAVALSLAVTALTDYLEKVQDAKTEQINFGKSTKDLIALQKKQLAEINALLWGMEEESAAREELINKATSLEKNLARLKEKLAKEEIKDKNKIAKVTTSWISKHKQLESVFIEWKKGRDTETKDDWIMWLETQRTLTIEQQEFLTELLLEQQELDTERKELEHQDFKDKITEKMELFQTFTNATMDIVNGYYDLKSQSIKNDLNSDLDAEETRYEARKAWINANIKDEEKRDEMLEKLEVGHSATQDNLREAAERKEKKYKQKMKKFQIGEAIINTAVGATKAWAQGGPFAGPFLAAMVTAAGMAKVALIRAQRFAKGAMAKVSTLAVFGEAGPEVALPLRSPETTAALGNALALAGAGKSGDTIIVNINRPLTSSQEARRQAHIIGTEVFKEVRRSRRI